MGVSVSQQFAPAQRAGFFYAAAATIPATWRNKSSQFITGRVPTNPGRVEAAQAGATGFIYLDPSVLTVSGTYHTLLFQQNSLGPAFGGMGGGTSFGAAVDILSNTSGYLNKLEAVTRRVKSENSWCTAIFCDDSGPDWAGYSSFSSGTKESVYLAWVAIAARWRAVADELGLWLTANGEWRGDTNHGYPARGTHGCSYMDNFCIEKHPYSEAPFWRVVMAGQWRLRDTAGFRGHLHITTNSTLTSQWGSEPNVGFIAEQGGGVYDANPSTAVASRTPHDLGISFTGATPSVSVSVAPQNVTLQTGATQQFTATVTGASDLPIWYVNGVKGGNSTLGTITSSGGLYTAPAAVPSPATVTITAQLVGGQSGSSPVTIQATTPAPPPSGGTPPAAPAALPGTFQDGNRFVGTTPNTGLTADLSRGCLIFWDAPGTITSMSALVDGLATGGVGAQSIRYVIYDDASGEPGALLGYTVDGTITAGDLPAWKELAMVTPLAQVAGPIHFHIHSGANVVGRYWFTTNTGVSRAATDTFVGGPIDPFSGASTGDADISIFATATPPGTTWPDGSTTDILAALLEARVYATSGKRLTATKTWDPASTADGAMTSTTITVAGAALGMPALAGFSVAVPAGAILAANVTATDTVTVTLFNKSGGTIDLASGTLRVDVRTS